WSSSPARSSGSATAPSISASRRPISSRPSSASSRTPRTRLRPEYSAAVDWRLYKDVYDVSLHHHWLGTLFSDVEQASIPFMVVATAALWLVARPGGDRKWKLASGSAFTAAALALVVNLVIHTVWDRPRPYESHSIAHPWSSSTDASFPSDHASASLAI